MRSWFSALRNPVGLEMLESLFFTEERRIVSLLAIPFTDLENGGSGRNRSGDIL